MSLDKDKDQQKKPVTSVDKYTAYLKANLCTFQTAGRRCQMLAGHYDLGAEIGLCGWHWINSSTPKLLQDYDEFVRYRDRDRESYPQEWLQASLYVEDAIVWACILGKEQRKEFMRALRVVESKCDKEVFGKNGRGTISENPPPPEVSVQEYAESLPF